MRSLPKRLVLPALVAVLGLGAILPVAGAADAPPAPGKLPPLPAAPRQGVADLAIVKSIHGKLVHPGQTSVTIGVYVADLSRKRAKVMAAYTGSRHFTPGFELCSVYRLVQTGSDIKPPFCNWGQARKATRRCSSVSAARSRPTPGRARRSRSASASTRR